MKIHSYFHDKAISVCNEGMPQKALAHSEDLYWNCSGFLFFQGDFT